MISSVAINNYKLFDNFTLHLPEGVTLIQGGNGCGKSALIEVIYALTQFLAMPSSSDHSAIGVDAAFPLKTLSRWLIRKVGYAETTISLNIDGEDEDANAYSFCYVLVIRYNFPENRCRVQNESLKAGDETLVRFADGKLTILSDDHRTIEFNADWNFSGIVTASRNNSRIRTFGHAVANIFCLHITPSQIQYSFDDTEQTLKVDASNFPAWRSYFATTYPENLVNIVKQCKYIISGLLSINDIKKGNSQYLNVRIRYEKKDYDFSFEELSDGQKALVILYSLLGNVSAGSVLFVDEPENYLAPTELQPWLNAINDVWEEKDIQIILVSHHPKTLAWYQNSAITFSLVGQPPHITLSYPSQAKE